MVKQNIKDASSPAGKAVSGIVISTKMDKTIVIKVNRTFKHPVLGKTLTRYKKYKAHDEKEMANVGDLVEIIESRPISKTKHMVLSSVLRKAA